MTDLEIKTAQLLDEQNKLLRFIGERPPTATEKAALAILTHTIEFLSAPV